MQGTNKGIISLKEKEEERIKKAIEKREEKLKEIRKK